MRSQQFTDNKTRVFGKMYGCFERMRTVFVKTGKTELKATAQRSFSTREVEYL